MSARNYLQTLGAGDKVRFPAGRYFFIRTAASALDITTEGNPGAPVQLLGIGAGTKFGPLPDGQGWKQLLISSAAAQNIEIIISDDGLFDVANAVTVNGSPTVQSLPAGALADTAPVAVPNAAQTPIVPANLSRRRVGISFASSAAIGPGTVFFRKTAGGQNLMEAQAGVLYTFEATYGVDVRNDSGGALSALVFEES